MNNFQEAIDYFKPMIKNCNDCSRAYDWTCIVETPINCKYIRVTLQALQKQVPYKPMMMQQREPEYMCQCGHKMYIPDSTYGMKPDNYCSFCGQKLDWSTTK